MYKQINYLIIVAGTHKILYSNNNLFGGSKAELPGWGDADRERDTNPIDDIRI